MDYRKVLVLAVILAYSNAYVNKLTECILYVNQSRSGLILSYKKGFSVGCVFLNIQM